MPAELIEYCRERLAPFKCPRTVEVVDALPRSDAGRILLHVLRDRYRPVEATPGRRVRA